MNLFLVARDMQLVKLVNFLETKILQKICLSQSYSFLSEIQMWHGTYLDEKLLLFDLSAPSLSPMASVSSPMGRVAASGVPALPGGSLATLLLLCSGPTCLPGVEAELRLWGLNGAVLSFLDGGREGNALLRLQSRKERSIRHSFSSLHQAGVELAA